MKKIIIPLFLFSIIFNIVFIYHLITVHRTDDEPNVLEDVILSENQESKIRDKTEAILKNNNELNIELKKCRKDLYDVLDKKNPDREKIMICIEAINNIQKKMQINTVEQLLIYKKHLSESQCNCFMKNIGVKMGVHHKCDHNCKCNK